MRAKRFDAVVLLANDLDESETVRVNPKFMSVLGQALVQSESPDLVKARDLFRSAANFGFDDTLMYRAWYHAERMSGYRFAEAIEVCRLVADNTKYSVRHRSEFSSKIGECLTTQARSISGVNNPDKAGLFSAAVVNYAWALHFAASSGELDRSKTLDWLSRALQGYISCSNGDFGLLLKGFETPIKTGLNFDGEMSQLVEKMISGASRSRDVNSLRKSQGTLNNGITAISRVTPKKYLSNVQALIDALDAGKKTFEVRIMQLTG